VAVGRHAQVAAVYVAHGKALVAALVGARGLGKKQGVDGDRVNYMFIQYDMKTQTGDPNGGLQPVGER
jgi:hypothetical protein